MANTPTTTISDKLNQVNILLNATNGISTFNTDVNTNISNGATQFAKITVADLQDNNIPIEIANLVSAIKNNTTLFNDIYTNLKNSISTDITSNHYSSVLLSNSTFQLNQLVCYLSEIMDQNYIVETTIDNLKFVTGKTATYVTEIKSIVNSCKTLDTICKTNHISLQNLIKSIAPSSLALENTLSGQIASNLLKAKESWKWNFRGQAISILADALNDTSTIIKNYQSMTGNKTLYGAGGTTVDVVNIYVGLAGVGTAVDLIGKSINLYAQDSGPSGAKVGFVNAMAAAGKVEYNEVLAALESL